MDYNDDSVLLGGMFFQEFYGYFQNDYSYVDTYYAKQYASLYIQENALWSPSISNVSLPAGPNPFSPNTPSSPGITTTLLIASIVGGALMLILLAVLIMCCCKDK